MITLKKLAKDYDPLDLYPLYGNSEELKDKTL